MKTVSDGAETTDAGSAFHTRGPATWNARSPTVRSLWSSMHTVCVVRQK